MDRAEKAGLGVALVGHAVLLVVMSLNLMSARPKPPLADAMDVMLVDKVALQSSSPTKAVEAPQQMEAPDIGKPEEATPPPEPTPAPTPPKPDPVPAPSPKPAPKQAKPTPAPPKPEAAKPAPEKPAAKPAKPKASNLGDDFLKGIPSAPKSPAKGTTARTAVISPIQANGLQALIASQVKPCYTVPTGGAGAMNIISRVHMRLKPDGSIAVAPEVVGNLGVTGDNQAYVRQMNEAAVRALQRCSPYKLPPELYEGGWEDIIFRFTPNAMN